MSGKFQTINRDTPYLLPPSIQDWLPEQHLARFIVDIVDQLDLSKLESCYGGGGKQPYHPALLLAMMFYGYATGVFSSRKLEQASHDSVAFRFITADGHPGHDTITAFCKRFLPELEGLFVQILVLASAMGLFKLGKVSLDGTKMKANASKHKALSWGHANKLEKTIDEHGEVNLLLNISHFHGWSPAALWEDLKFDLKHYRHMSRLALVAEDSDKQWMATLAKPGPAIFRLRGISLMSHISDSGA
jgi:transposase